MVEPATKQGVNAAGIPSFGPSGVGIWSAPTVDTKRGILYVTTGDNYSAPASAMSDSVVALDAKSGRIVWSQQVTSGDVFNAACPGGTNCPSKPGPDHEFGASAILIDSHGRNTLAVGQKSGMVYGLDADRGGAILWQTRVWQGGRLGGIEWGMASDGKRIYAAVSDAVRLDDTATGPAALGATNFDPMHGGGLTALSLQGERVWFVPGQACQPPRPGCSPAQPAAVSAATDIVFSGSQDGHLRAFATVSGQIMWDFDTAREYTTVNGVIARGGSLDGAGPIIAVGGLYVTSGSSRFGGMPGNVLLAFSAD